MRMFIGIDSDIDLSGVATLSIGDEGRNLRVDKMCFADLCAHFQMLKQAERSGAQIRIIFEASWLIQSNWHLTKTKGKADSAKVGYKVGRNHQVGICLCEFARGLNLDVVERKPLQLRSGGFHFWSGKDGKITQEELNEVLRNAGFDQMRVRHNQEERDAALLAIVEAGLPIRCRIKP